MLVPFPCVGELISSVALSAEGRLRAHAGSTSVTDSGEQDAAESRAEGQDWEQLLGRGRLVVRWETY